MNSLPPEVSSRTPPVPSRKLRWQPILAAGLLLVALLTLWGRWWLSPVSRTPRPVSLLISGGGAAQIGHQLQQNGIVRSHLAFLFVARTRGADTQLKAGRYLLSPHMSLAEIVQTLEAGPTRSLEEVVRVTIPEGYTLRQIADLFTRRKVTDGSRLLQIATDPHAFGHLNPGFPLPSETLEGYLFPDTYEFRPGTEAEKVLRTLLLNFEARFARPYLQEIERSGRSLHTLVTAASLVEREARVPQDRARIAGVLDNRLQRNMRLQVDATVLYALGEHRERVLFRDLKVDSPYNTYRYRGLPPGPIASPGLAALEAVLRPEAHDYFYYVARSDGSHLFTRTLAEHQAAIQRVRRERRSEGQEIPPRG